MLCILESGVYKIEYSNFLMIILVWTNENWQILEYTINDSEICYINLSKSCIEKNLSLIYLLIQFLLH